MIYCRGCFVACWSTRIAEATSVQRLYLFAITRPVWDWDDWVLICFDLEQELLPMHCITLYHLRAIVLEWTNGAKHLNVRQTEGYGTPYQSFRVCLGGAYTERTMKNNRAFAAWTVPSFCESCIAWDDLKRTHDIFNWYTIYIWLLYTR